jgi:cytochrome c biogenesis protein CcmG/thiol:disulfide interchange protein DsbE
VKRALYVLPALGFVVVAAFLFYSLRGPAPDVLSSAMVGKPVPRLTLPPLDGTTQGFGARELAAGHVTVVNVFASWCVPCRTEAPVLARLAASGNVALYGLVQKDTAAKVHAFLEDVGGNPFQRIALDADGRASIEWGVYGVPETFVIDGRGIIRARFVGALTDDMLANDLLPAIAQARSSS